MFYNVVLFLHIFGAVVMFSAIAILLSAMIALLHAKDTKSIASWSNLATKTDALMPPGTLLVLIPGLYLVFTRWGWGNAWVNVSLVTLVAMAIMGPVINLRRLKSILQVVENEASDAPSYELLKKIRDRVLWNSVMVMTMFMVSILFLMTVKLALVGSLIVLIVAVVIGLISSGVILNRADASAVFQSQETLEN